MAKGKKGKGRKAPGLGSLVVWRQLLMVLAAPGAALSLLPLLDMDPQSNFMIGVVAMAVPSLIHGQLWNWSYSWADKGPKTVRQLRVGQIGLGALHCGLVGFALLRVALEQVPWEGAGFYYGLAMAGLLAGAWETARPILELRKDQDPQSTDTPPAAPKD